MITILIQTIASLYVSVCTCVFLGFLGCCLLWDGVLESEWGLFTPPLSSTTPLACNEGGLPGGFSTVQVPSLIFLSWVSLFSCTPESLWVCSPIIQMPVASLSSSEEAVEIFGFTTFIWGYCCGSKSAVVSAPCLGSVTFIFILVPWVQEKSEVNTGRAPCASVRLHTLGCRQVSQRLH